MVEGIAEKKRLEPLTENRYRGPGMSECPMARSFRVCAIQMCTLITTIGGWYHALDPSLSAHSSCE